MKVRLLLFLVSVLLPTFVLAEMGSKSFHVGKAQEFKDVKFAYKSATVNPNYYSMLDKVYDALKQNPHLRVSIQGYSDDAGSASENMRLSQMRAMHVEEYLTGRGLATHRVEISWHGDNTPFASNSTDSGKAHNRGASVSLIRRDIMKELPKDLGLTE